MDKEIKRTLKNNIVAQIMEADKEGGAYVDLLPVVKVVQWSKKGGPESALRSFIMKKHPEAKIVNDMPMEKVREIWEGLPRG